MSLPLRMTLLALLISALVTFGLFVIDGGDGASTADGGQAQFRSSLECARCHRKLWNEWHGSHHQIAYLNPEVQMLSDNFRNKECQACHLPRPIAVTGYARRTLPRSLLPDEGVSCLTCHLGADGEILGRNSMPDAPCRPQASAELVSVALCESCHNQHETTDQWRQTPFATAGTDCNACHMLKVLRNNGRLGRGHEFAGSHDVDVLRSALGFASAVDNGELVISVENLGAGHNFPTEERSRAADLLLRFDDAGDWQQAYRFRLPYRSEPLPDTTLPFGEVKQVRVAIPDGSQRVTVRLWYRLTPFVQDDDARSALLFEQELELDGTTAVIGPLARPPLPEGSAFLPVEDPSEIPGPAVVETAQATPDSTEAGFSSPALPPLQLEPKLEYFEQLAASGPTRPDEDRMLALRDLLLTALAPESASTRLAARARRSLLEAADAHWVLEEALDHETAALRMQAAFALGELGATASLSPLLLRLKNEVNEFEADASTVIIWLVDAIARLGNHSAVPYLIPLMEREDSAELAGQQAIQICLEAGEELGASPSWDEIAAGLRRLYAKWQSSGGSLSPDALMRARIAAHIANLEDFQLRGVDEARFVLARLGTAALPLLREALHASEPYLRAHVLEILRELGPLAGSAAVDVMPLLADDLTRVDAVQTLGRIRAAEAGPYLLALLGSDDLELRAAAAAALGELGEATAIAPLEKLLADEGQALDVRVPAAYGLALLSPDGPGRAYLEGLLARGGYHAPTLQELLDRIGRGR